MVRCGQSDASMTRGSLYGGEPCRPGTRASSLSRDDFIPCLYETLEAGWLAKNNHCLTAINSNIFSCMIQNSHFHDYNPQNRFQTTFKIEIYRENRTSIKHSRERGVSQ